MESFQKQREFADGGVRCSGRSRTALLAAPYAPARVKVANEARSMAQLVAEELVDTGFTSHYETVDWTVPLVLGSMTAAHPWMPSVRWQRQVVPLFV